MALKTQYEQKMEKRNAAIYRDWKRLRSNPANRPTEINKVLMAKYNLNAPSSIYRVINAIEAAKSYCGDDDGRAE